MSCSNQAVFEATQHTAVCSSLVVLMANTVISLQQSATSYMIPITNWADNPHVCCERGFLFCRQKQSGYTYQLLLQVDAHLTNFIADLRLRQADPLAILPASTTSQASIQQHSRLAALTLPLRLPDSCSEHDSTHAQSSQTASTTVDPVQEGSGESQPAVAADGAVSLGKPLDAQQI